MDRAIAALMMARASQAQAQSPAEAAGYRPARPPRAEIPEPAQRPPWPRRPSAGLCEAQPARWAALRERRDAPREFYGTTGMSSWARGLGQPVERALRSSPADCWWFDPELPLATILGGWPQWDRDGRRRDNPEEDAEEFAELVADYEREMRAGAVFPPLVVFGIEPVPDREAAGFRRYFSFVDRAWTDLPHVQLGNGRHRAAAAYRAGQRTFAAYVIGPARDVYEVNRAHGDQWLLPVAATARERGRAGMTLAALEQLGRVPSREAVASGQAVPVAIPGPYLSGECAALAVALAELTGWPLIEVMPPTYHVLARCPDGRYLDAAGLHDSACLDGFTWRHGDGEDLARRYGRQAREPRVMADARELLRLLDAGELPVVPLSWHPGQPAVIVTEDVS